MSKLTAETEKSIRDLCAQGYERYDQADFKAALRLFYKAWTQLPKPQPDYAPSTWVLTAIGDCYFANSDYLNGIEALRSALHCPEGEQNPFIHLRLGQCYFALGQLKEAKTILKRALELGGETVFAKEDAKYLDFARKVAHLV